MFQQTHGPCAYDMCMPFEGNSRACIRVFLLYYRVLRLLIVVSAGHHADGTFIRSVPCVFPARMILSYHLRKIFFFRRHMRCACCSVTYSRAYIRACVNITGWVARAPCSW